MNILLHLHKRSQSVSQNMQATTPNREKAKRNTYKQLLQIIDIFVLKNLGKN